MSYNQFLARWINERAESAHAGVGVGVVVGGGGAMASRYVRL